MFSSANLLMFYFFLLTLQQSILLLPKFLEFSFPIFSIILMKNTLILFIAPPLIYPYTLYFNFSSIRVYNQINFP